MNNIIVGIKAPLQHKFTDIVETLNELYNRGYIQKCEYNAFVLNEDSSVHDIDYTSSSRLHDVGKILNGSLKEINNHKYSNRDKTDKIVSLTTTDDVTRRIYHPLYFPYAHLISRISDVLPVDKGYPGGRKINGHIILDTEFKMKTCKCKCKHKGSVFLGTKNTELISEWGEDIIDKLLEIYPYHSPEMLNVRDILSIKSTKDIFSSIICDLNIKLLLRSNYYGFIKYNSLEYLALSNTNLDIIPNYLHNIAPNLTVLCLSHCNIVDISIYSNLSKLTKLSLLDLSHNPLKCIEPNSLPPSLESLVVDNCRDLVLDNTILDTNITSLSLFIPFYSQEDKYLYDGFHLTIVNQLLPRLVFLNYNISDLRYLNISSITHNISLGLWKLTNSDAIILESIKYKIKYLFLYTDFDILDNIRDKFPYLIGIQLRCCYFKSTAKKIRASKQVKTNPGCQSFHKDMYH